MAIALPLRSVAFPWNRLLAVCTSEVVTVGGLIGLALLARWPNLLLSPRFPSVDSGIGIALELAAGRSFPLSDQAPYIGAIFIYLLAAIYRLFGPSLEATLLVPWAIGGLTVLPTYLLGRELGGRAVGLIAAALMTTAGAHIVVSSHVPQSHSLTPLLATTSLWLLARAATRRDPRALALAGLTAGLSLQTHPTVLPLLAGAGVMLLLGRPAWLRTRWPYLALALALLGYSTLLVYQAQSRLAIVDDIRGKQARYLDADADPGEDAESGVYLNNLHRLGLSLARLTAGAIDEREAASDYLLDPRVLAYLALALTGLGLAARRARPLLFAGLLPSIFVPPLLSGKYEPILDGRYLMPLVPLLFVGIGLVVAAAARALLAGWPRQLGGLALALGLAWLILHPLVLLGQFYEDSIEDGASNAGYLRTLEQLKWARSGDEAVVLDAELVRVKGKGGGNAGGSFRWLLAVSGLPTTTWQSSDDPRALSGRLAVLHRETVERLNGRIELLPLEQLSSRAARGQTYRAYRLSALAQ